MDPALDLAYSAAALARSACEYAAKGWWLSDTALRPTNASLALWPRTARLCAKSGDFLNAWVRPSLLRHVGLGRRRLDLPSRDIWSWVIAEPKRGDHPSPQTISRYGWPPADR